MELVGDIDSGGEMKMKIEIGSVQRQRPEPTFSVRCLHFLLEHQ